MRRQEENIFCVFTRKKMFFDLDAYGAAAHRVSLSHERRAWRSLCADECIRRSRSSSELVSREEGMAQTCQRASFTCEWTARSSLNNYGDIIMENIIISLILDGDVELDCQVMAIFEAGGRDYVALSPLSGEDEGEIYLYRYSEEEDGTPIVDNIEDDDEYELVDEAFDELLDSQEFDELVDASDYE